MQLDDGLLVRTAIVLSKEKHVLSRPRRYVLLLTGK
jgi:hypothetical protein